MNWFALRTAFGACCLFAFGFHCQARPAPDFQCLDDAIPKATWKDLVNPAGESYPIGMWVNDWPSGHLAAVVAQILIQETGKLKCFMSLLPLRIL